MRDGLKHCFSLGGDDARVEAKEIGGPWTEQRKRAAEEHGKKAWLCEKTLDRGEGNDSSVLFFIFSKFRLSSLVCSVKNKAGLILKNFPFQKRHSGSFLLLHGRLEMESQY